MQDGVRVEMANDYNILYFMKVGDAVPLEARRREVIQPGRYCTVPLLPLYRRWLFLQSGLRYGNGRDDGMI